MRRDVFQAISDPHRREILGLLIGRKLTLNGLAENFAISRPAISKHVRILSECGLVRVSRQGRERYCEARFDKLSEVYQWVEPYKKFWTEKLGALENYLNDVQMKERLDGRT